MGKQTKKQIEKIRNQPVNFGMLDEAVHTVLDGVERMFTDPKSGINGRFEKLEDKIDFVHSDLKHQIDDLKYDTPTRKEFNDLKTRVGTYHPAS